MSAEELRSGAVAGAIRRHRLLVVLRRIEPRDRLLSLADELADAGARIFEITLDAPAGDDDLAAVRSRLTSRPDGPFLVGAGTVRTHEQLGAARRAGADFAVAPLFDPAVTAASAASGLPFIPGAMSPTELASAWGAGATFVKLFPASALGASFVHELRGPMPEIEIIPTGGVDGDSAAGFLAAGAVAVGIGGALLRASPEARRALVRSVTEQEGAR